MLPLSNRFLPPKVEINKKDVHNILLIGLNKGFWELELIYNFSVNNYFFDQKKLNFIPEKSNLPSVEKTFWQDYCWQKAQEVVDKMPANILIDYLQNFYNSLANKNFTYFLMYLLILVKSKERYTEMLAINHYKLPTEKELTDKIRDLLTLF